QPTGAIMHIQAQALASAPAPRRSLLRQYQTIAAISDEMADKAQAGQWNEVTELGEQYFQAVEALKELSPLSTDDRLARRELLTRILDNDARIRHLVSPELERLNKLLGNLKRQQNVLHTYSSAILSP